MFNNWYFCSCHPISKYVIHTTNDWIVTCIYKYVKDEYKPRFDKGPKTRSGLFISGFSLFKSKLISILEGGTSRQSGRVRSAMFVARLDRFFDLSIRHSFNYSIQFSDSSVSQSSVCSFWRSTRRKKHKGPWKTRKLRARSFSLSQGWTSCE